MINVMVAAPVMDRAWVLPTWLSTIAAQRTPEIDVEVALFWEPAPWGEEGPDETLEAIRTFQTDLPPLGLRKPMRVMVLTDETMGPTPRSAEDVDTHRWDMPAYEHMAKMRNRLAKRARLKGFDYLFMLDTDVLLHPPRWVAEHPDDNRLFPVPMGGESALAQELLMRWRSGQMRLAGDLELLLDGLTAKTIVGPLVNLARATPEQQTPLAWNYREWANHAPKDADETPVWSQEPAADLCMGSGRHEVDVLVAAILMPVSEGMPSWIGYPQGEDVGFCAQAHKSGWRFLVDTDIVCRHLMNKRVLPPLATV